MNSNGVGYPTASQPVMPTGVDKKCPQTESPHPENWFTEHVKIFSKAMVH